MYLGLSSFDCMLHTDLIACLATSSATADQLQGLCNLLTVLFILEQCAALVLKV